MLSQKQEMFCINYFSTSNATQSAIKAEYSPASAHVIGSRLLRTAKVKERLHELNEEARSEAIASVIERKEVITDIIRGRLSDFVDEDGHIDIQGRESLKSAAVQEIKTTRWSGGKDERASSVTTTLKLRDPLAAIAELNKMEGDYAPERHAVIGDILIEVVYVDAEKSIPRLRATNPGSRGTD